MVLNKYRSTADRIMVPLAQRFIDWSPDTLSWAAFACAVPAGFLFWAAGRWHYAILLLAALFVALNAGFDALDGWVARLTGKATRRGDLLDHVLDRYADVFMVGGIAVSAYCHLWVGMLGILGVLFTSYMGTQAQALGLRRDYGGILGRADRMALLFFAPLIQWLWRLVTHRIELFTLDVAGVHYGLTVLEVLVIWFAIAGNATALQRAMASWRALTNESGGGKASPEDGMPVPDAGAEASTRPTAPAPVPRDGTPPTDGRDGGQGD